jgi:hypothetical protein
MGGRVVVRVIANKQGTLALLLPPPLMQVKSTAKIDYLRP